MTGFPGRNILQGRLWASAPRGFEQKVSLLIQGYGNIYRSVQSRSRCVWASERMSSPYPKSDTVVLFHRPLQELQTMVIALFRLAVDRLANLNQDRFRQLDIMELRGQVVAMVGHSHDRICAPVKLVAVSRQMAQYVPAFYAGGICLGRWGPENDHTHSAHDRRERSILGRSESDIDDMHLNYESAAWIRELSLHHRHRSN
jgi:hypothetical protein